MKTLYRPFTTQLQLKFSFFLSTPSHVPRPTPVEIFHETKANLDVIISAGRIGKWNPSARARGRRERVSFSVADTTRRRIYYITSGSLTQQHCLNRIHFHESGYRPRAERESVSRCRWVSSKMKIVKRDDD